uniref:Autophagy-related protein 9 n=1 Tax=Panagrellus redivivus TaxID=6233 RepID=A0A7E4VGZ5_PANRE
MSLFNTLNRGQYQTIDGEDEEAGPLLNPLDGAPPTSHHIVEEETYQNSPSRRRQSSVSISISRGGPQRWDHIENLDQFFLQVYKYHQGSGFRCILLKHALSLFQIAFVIAFSTFLTQCIDYDVLFNNRATNTDGKNITGKRHIADAIVTDCAAHFSPLVVLTLLLSVLFLVFHMVRVGYQMVQYMDIQEFYNSVLEIPDNQLTNVTWRTIVQRICAVQPKIRLSVNQTKFTELDIYARILRQKNFMVALVYDEILPPFFDLPFLGRIPYFPSGMRLNLETILFKHFWSPWKNHYQLKDEFKDLHSLETVAQSLRKTIMLFALANFFLMPLIFVYQLLFTFFSCADLLKREPGAFGMRKYSNYGREKLRHFNELDHELRLRLNRSYEFSVRYMDQFISPSTEIIAKNLAFVAGSIAVVVAGLTAWDEDVLTFEHVITVMSVSAAIAYACRSFIADENLVFCPDFLMRQIVANIHYAPAAWLREAQSTDVVAEFEQVFHMRAYAVILDLISPIVTPFILFFSTSLQAHAIVQFFHEKTRSIPELGDVCVYALMDLRENADADLAELSGVTSSGPVPRARRPNAIRAKIELSLLNFATQNPDWQAPENLANFLAQVRDRTKDTPLNNLGNLADPTAPQAADNDVLLHSLKDLQRPVAQSMGQSAYQRNADLSMMASHLSDGTNDERMHPLMNASNDPLTNSVIQSTVGLNFSKPARLQESNRQALEMSMNALLVNRMLQSTHSRHHSAEPSPFYGSTIQTSAYPTSTPGPNAVGLTSFFGGASGLQDHTAEEEEARDEMPPLRMHESAESDIWGVPSQSQFQSRYGDSRYDQI